MEISMSDSFVQALEAHTEEDHKFQDETRFFNEEMGIFKAETEGSFSLIHEKLDLILKKQQVNDNRFDPKHEDYAFTKMDLMYDVYEGLGFGRKALINVAGVVGSISVIIIGIFSAIRYIK